MLLVFIQGKKKKQFINKKEAHSYKLVPRSHQDPLAGDSSEAQHVLMPAQSQVSHFCMNYDAH